jgi:competence protein ComEC
MQFTRRHLLASFTGALLILTAAIWGAVYQREPFDGAQGKQSVLTFAMLDIGQGDSLYIEGPTGLQVLVDGGPDSSVLTALPTVMPFLDHSLDAVVETHPDADHIGGLVDVLQRYSVGAFIEPGITKHNATNDKLESEVTAENIPHYTARRGMWLDLGGGARLNILYPDWDVTNMDLSKDNDGGIVAHLVYGDTSVLLTADTSSVVEEHLEQIASTSELKSTILKVAHHGSRFSSEEPFVAEVAPQVALISVGAHNTYGHPTPQTLSTLASLNIPVLRTDQDGTIIYKSDGKIFTRVQ